MSDKQDKQVSKNEDGGTSKPKHRRPRPRKSVRNLATKIIIRHLPPNLNSEQFVEQVSPFLDQSNYYYYVKGDPLLGQFSYSRAYINFENQEDILHFREKFDNYVFMDDKGNEYTAIVELALYQGVPKKRNKLDPKCKTIESDPNFLQFIENKENLSKADVNLPSVENYLEEIEAKEKVTKPLSTPLLDFLNSKKKGTGSSGSSSNKKRQSAREEGKKKEESRRKQWKTGESSGAAFKANKDGNRDGNRDSNRDGNRDVNKDGNKDNNRESNKEPRKRERYRRRRDDKKGDDKPKDDTKSANKKLNNSTSTNKKEEPKTFTVKILTNEKRLNSQLNAENKPKPSSTSDAATSSKDNSKRSSNDKVRNRERPSIQIYRPPRQSQSKKEEDSNLRR